MKKWLIFMMIGLSGLCLSCSPEDDKIREEMEHIANQEGARE